VKAAHLLELVVLAALWGASFLFTRMGAAEFGPVALIAVRVSGAALFLMPLLMMRGQLAVLRRHWRPIFVVGLTNSALPFLCFGYAALSLDAGLSAIFNAASPLFGAAIAWWWLKDKLSPARMVGLLIGFGGVAWLAWNRSSHESAFKPGGSGWAVVACIGASVLYGVAANYTKKRLTGVAPMAIAAGSQLGAALALAIPAWLWWPAASPSGAGWLTAALLAIFSTGVAYVLYFRLIANVGPQNAIAVTYLVPAFAVLWGWMLLDEQPTLAMAVGCAVILFGTSLATGLLKPNAIRRQFIGRPT
jgi:drug/metabolite transporter (DMT)-like permease